jgi:antitoxin ParD1/3/4
MLRALAGSVTLLLLGRRRNSRSLSGETVLIYHTRKSDETLLQKGAAMGLVQKRTFSLPARQAKFIDSKVRAGAYASASEVVRAGLRALQERDAAVADWLRSEVGPVYDAMRANPERGIPAEKVFAALRTRHSAKLKGRKRAT